MYDTFINIIENGDTVKLTDFEQSKTLFASIDLSSVITEIKKESSGLIGSNIIATIINSSTKKEIKYKLDSEPKELIANQKNICLNSGTEAVFLNQNGVLIKKYTSNSEMQKIVLGKSIAGIIYNDEIKIISL